MDQEALACIAAPIAAYQLDTTTNMTAASGAKRRTAIPVIAQYPVHGPSIQYSLSNNANRTNRWSVGSPKFLQGFGRRLWEVTSDGNRFLVMFL